MFTSIFPPIPTPFDDSGQIDLDALRANIARWNDTGLAGYVALGSNGEAPLLDADESSALVRAVRKAMAPGMRLIAGAGRESTRETIRACHMAADAGAEAVLVITPWYYDRAMSGDALRRHYEAVAGASPIPVLLYNMPANTASTSPSPPSRNWPHILTSSVSKTAPATSANCRPSCAPHPTTSRS